MAPPRQEIVLEAWCEKGVGKTHAKWSPVSTASYRLLPELGIREPLPADEAAAAQRRRPPAVFDVEAEGEAGQGAPAAREARPRGSAKSSRSSTATASPASR